MDTSPTSCDWPVILPPCAALDPVRGATEAPNFERMAADYLWNWTGRRFGVCPVTVRPTRSDCACSSRYRPTWFEGNGPRTTFGSGIGVPWTPVLVGGRWFNIYCDECSWGGCECLGGTRRLRLPGPVASITRVRIDGTDLPTTAYYLAGSTLIRTDGGTWPTHQDLDAPATAAGTFEVTYGRGYPVPEGGQIAAGLLACELAKAARGDSDCQLPQRLQTVTRQGVSVAVMDQFDDVNKGRTGIWAIDAWVASVTAPVHRPGRVFSPDIRRRTR